jgi:hypothetical protein
MGRLRHWWLTGLSPWVKAVYLVLLANGVPAFCILMSIPAKTETFFVWTVKPEASARMLGVMYTNALLLVVLGFLQPDWPRARITLVVIAPFSIAATIVTFLNIAPFLKHPWYHLTYWLTMYLILFFAAPIVFIAQERAHGGKLPILAPLSPLARTYVACAAVATGVTGIGLLIRPDVINRLWPWTLTPLVSRILGVWFSTLALAHGWAVWDGDWQRTRIIFWQAIPTGILTALVPIIHHDDLRGDRGPLALYLILALGASAMALLVTVTSARQEEKLPRAVGVVGEIRPEQG